MNPIRPSWSKAAHTSITHALSNVWTTHIPILETLSTVSVIVICLARKTSILNTAVALLSSVAPGEGHPTIITLPIPFMDRIYRISDSHHDCYHIISCRIVYICIVKGSTYISYRRYKTD